jgi:hypothetical protein
LFESLSFVESFVTWLFASLAERKIRQFMNPLSKCASFPPVSPVNVPRIRRQAQSARFAASTEAESSIFIDAHFACLPAQELSLARTQYKSKAPPMSEDVERRFAR